MEAQVESSYNQPSGEPRNQGQQALNQASVPTYIRPGPGTLAQAALCHRTCVHTASLPALEGKREGLERLLTT